MTNPNDVVRGAIYLDSFLEGKCFKSWDEFVQALPSMLAVEVPASVSNVSVGNTQPNDDERDNLWVRKDNSGSFMGLFVYSQGAWQQIYPPPNAASLVLGDSRNVPAGYILASDASFVDVNTLAKLMTMWEVGGLGPPVWYKMFHIFYVGV
jgi:hypothetical protein